MPIEGNSDDSDESNRFTRRDVLNASAALGTGALAANAGIASAEGEESDEYAAAPVSLGESASERGYQLRGADRTDRETEAGVAYESAAVAYERPELAYGLFATPDLRELGHEPSRSGAADPVEFLHTRAGRELLGALGVGEYGAEWETLEPFAENPGSAEPRLFDREAEMVSLVGVLEGGTAVLAHVSRVVHDGDVVFAVDARGRALDEGDYEELLGDGDGAVYETDYQPAWGDWHASAGYDADRIPPVEVCSALVDVDITHPPDEEYIGPRGQLKKAGIGVKRGINGTPYAALHPRADAQGCYDHLEWSYRMITEGGSCGNETGKWVDLGNGECTTMHLHDCECSLTYWEIRVEAVDSQGAVLASDTHTVKINLWGC